MRHKITLLTKIVGVAALCLSLAGCPVFCVCVDILAFNGQEGWRSDCHPYTAYDSQAEEDWAHAAQALTLEGQGHCEVARISGSWAAVAEDVEASITGLPQSRSQRVLTPCPPARIDCTDPANAGRGSCAGTNRQNKPLSPPGG